MASIAFPTGHVAVKTQERTFIRRGDGRRRARPASPSRFTRPAPYHVLARDAGEAGGEVRGAIVDNTGLG